jgi:hypothetical protein
VLVRDAIRGGDENGNGGVDLLIATAREAHGLGPLFLAHPQRVEEELRPQIGAGMPPVRGRSQGSSRQRGRLLLVVEEQDRDPAHDGERVPMRANQGSLLLP